MHLATIIFALTYLLISLGENSPRKLDRPTAALLGAVLMVMTGSLTRREAAAALDFSTLAVLFGMMVLLAVLMQSAQRLFEQGQRAHSPQLARGLASELQIIDIYLTGKIPCTLVKGASIGVYIL